MDILTAIFAANKAKADLQKSGGVGYNVWGVIFPETELNLSLDGSFSKFEEYLEPDLFTLTAGQKYKVVWNGAAYYCDTVSLSDDSTTFHTIGNMAIVNSDFVDTGEPFVIINEIGNDDNSFLRVVTEDSTATMSIFEKTANPIAGEYLTETRVVIDMPISFEVLLSGNEIPLDANMADMIESAAKNHKPLYLRLPISDYSLGILKVECEQIDTSDSTKTKYLFTGLSANVGTPAIAVIVLGRGSYDWVAGSATFLAVE